MRVQRRLRKPHKIKVTSLKIAIIRMRVKMGNKAQRILRVQ